MQGRVSGAGWPCDWRDTRIPWWLQQHQSTSLSLWVPGGERTQNWSCRTHSSRMEVVFTMECVYGSPIGKNYIQRNSHFECTAPHYLNLKPWVLLTSPQPLHYLRAHHFQLVCSKEDRSPGPVESQLQPIESQRYHSILSETPTLLPHQVGAIPIRVIINDKMLFWMKCMKLISTTFSWETAYFM